ncbi:MAG: gliding motility-associated C-terminal domain-containing protein [Bacteroidetes bacterium]|nr:gliding motility-associated C-terminal domain-containing protein [Bacteroidota bacterium]
MVNSRGCDSFLTLNLKVDTISNKSITRGFCPSKSYNFNGTLLSAAGTYNSTFKNAKGCDSFVTLTLLAYQNSNGNYTKHICDGEQYFFNNAMRSGNGIFIDTISNYTGCDSFLTLNLISHALPTANIFSLRDSICLGDTLILKASGGLRYTWNTKETNASIQIQPKINSNYTVTAYNDYCQHDTSKKIEVMFHLVEIKSNVDIVKSGDSIELTAVGNTPSRWVEWNPIKSTKNPLRYKPLKSEIVEVISKDSAGCIAKDLHRVEVQVGGRLIIPTGFSPNGDGVNDIFRPIFSGEVDIQTFDVFNRWGQKVHDYSEHKNWLGWP